MRTLLLLAVLGLAPLAHAQPSVAGGFTLDTLQNPVPGGRGLAIGPDGRVFFTANDGSFGRVFCLDTTQTPAVLTTFATVSNYTPPASDDNGMHGIVLDPLFPLAPGDATNRYVYVCYSANPSGSLTVVRYTENVSSLGTALALSETTVINPVAMGANGVNFGGSLAIGPDGNLCVGVGDASTSVPLGGAQAQDTADRRGKVLRVIRGGPQIGQPPLNNPISLNPMFARGFRNPRGLAFNPGTGELFCTDSGNPAGPGADELNVVLSGGNYGWDTAGASGARGVAGMTDPAWVLPGNFEPGGVAFYPPSATAFPAIGHRTACVYLGRETTVGNVSFPVIGPKTGAMVVRVILTGGSERAAVAMWPMVTDLPSAVRGVQFGPDGHLYILTETVLYRLRYTGGTGSAPVANAGLNQSVNEGTLVTLNGTGSFDPDATDVLRFTWRQAGGSTVVTLANATSASATFTAPQVPFDQTFTFELIVEDGNGNFDSKLVQVQVKDVGGGGGNDGPLLEAPGEGGCSTGEGTAWVAWLAALLCALALLARRARAWR
ncbi:MAG: PQQ-dependent sugar dehydrogenase [Planctomycetes bacterium]|nr:PQQ-dependent sugar dehydrogenase [Planctomycetota bacterium]MCL4729697.1 PQQ-dependent sugar dehydrogenase [Planctomycetota bacterium]